MKATLIDKMGSDLTVVNAARVSFSKASEAEYTTVSDGEVTVHLHERDDKLIKYLAEHNHWTPFGHCQAQFHIKAPIFLARQMVKHQIGLVWNEVSRRYVDDEPELWWPEGWRLRAENVKQGSSEEYVRHSDVGEPIVKTAEHAVDTYRQILANGIAPEMARIILPLNMYTEWYWTGSLAAWSRVCRLRLDPHAQKEAQDLAQQISDQMGHAFPVSWSALMGDQAS